MFYVPLPAPYRDAWQSPVLDQRADEYREAGANLAANAFDIVRTEGFRDRTAHSPYPRLRALLTALDGAVTVADGRGYRFADPGTGSELRLAYIPWTGASMPARLRLRHRLLKAPRRPRRARG